MTKATLLMTLCGVLVLAGCANREPATVRNGPQIENPNANAPGGKMPSDARAQSSGIVQNVIIDDSAGSVMAAPTTGSIFEFQG